MQLNLIRHNGQDLFLTGVNIGSIQFLPFEGNPYGYSAGQMRAVLNNALADIAATGANSVRFWLHIDGSRSPNWGVDQVRLLHPVAVAAVLNITTRLVVHPCLPGTVPTLNIPSAVVDYSTNLVL